MGLAAGVAAKERKEHKETDANGDTGPAGKGMMLAGLGTTWKSSLPYQLREAVAMD